MIGPVLSFIAPLGLYIPVQSGVRISVIIAPSTPVTSGWDMSAYRAAGQPKIFLQRSGFAATWQHTSYVQVGETTQQNAMLINQIVKLK